MVWPPPVLPTNTHDIHTVSECRHVFTTPLFFINYHFMSAYRHVNMSAYIPPLPLIADIFYFLIWGGQCFGLSECFAPTPYILHDIDINHILLSPCRHVGMVWPPPYIADKRTCHTYGVGIFLQQPHFFLSIIIRYRYVDMSTGRHISPPLS